jgi:hypothetical protein
MQGYLGLVPPCGIVCGGCPKYVRDKNPCPGAETGCRKCRSIYVCCVEKKGHRICSECATFPCSRFEKFAQAWLKYGQDLVANQEQLQCLGPDRRLEAWNDKTQGEETNETD